MLTVTPIRTGEFAAFAPSPSTAVIRIYDPSDDWAEDAAREQAAGWGAVLPLTFWDMGPAEMGVFGTLLVRLLGGHREACLAVARRVFGAEGPWRPFLAADARDVVEFADELKRRGMTQVLVVCRNGRGRSGALAQWLARRLGAEPPAVIASEFICRTLDRAA